MFSHVHTTDAVAADWITRYQQNNADAMCDLINFVVRCTGCPLQLDVHDMEDPDNAPSRLEDLQNAFYAQKIADYPLISKAKSHATFRSTMTGFFHSLMSTAYAAGILFTEPVFHENIEVWVLPMTDSTIRPFRHTATVIALAIGSTICSLTAEIANDTAKIARQKENEQKKKGVNKERVRGLEARIVEGEEKQAAAQRQAEGLFDAVYTQRYRDVDAKIRLDCVAAFGSWITSCPEVFFSGHYIRYLGWVLSDTASAVRSEVIKTLFKLYRNKEDVGRMRAFTEKFRPRLVEMAIRDAEPSIRASTVDLMNIIRETGLLEPDDIDNIGRLIFDTEPRVRKAVSGFFAENINDLFESVVEDLGGDEGISEAIGEEIEDEYDIPRKSWLKYKCLAEQLQGYDGEEGEFFENAKTLSAVGEESRLSLAAQAVYAGVKEVTEWEALAGYLLFDLSNVSHDSTEPDEAFKARCQLNEREEVLLLETLHVSVKSRLTEAVANETDSKGRSTKARKEESREIQEATALHLAKVIPRLLKKFGANPGTASAVLRLGQVLNLEIFQELRQDSTDYASLLDDINKQFLTHADQGVLTEASTALLHARSFQDLEEVTEAKVQELWEDTINTLRNLSSAPRDAATTIPNLSNTVRRIGNLASISNCTEYFEAQPRSTKKSAKDPSTPLTILLNLLEEFTEQANLDAETAESANELLQSGIKAILFYYMWLVRSLRSKLDSGNPIPTFPSYAPFAEILLSLISARTHIDAVRLAAAGAYLDIHTLFATFRHTKAPSSTQPITTQTIPSSVLPLLVSIFASAEKNFAKRARKTLEPETDDAPEDDLDLEPSDPESEDVDDADDGMAQRKRTSLLLAEKSLCELAGKIVLALVGRVFEDKDRGKLKERLMRNEVKLGPNFREVLAHLEPPKQKRRAPVRKGVAQKKVGAKGKGKGKGKKSEEVVREEEVESIQDEEEGDGREQLEIEEGGEEDLRRRELDDGEDGIESVGSEVGDDGGRGGGEDEEDEIMGD